MTAHLSDARERVRECAGPELVERLEHLDRSRSERPRDDRPPRAPDRGATVDFDVALVGGGLSLLYAPTLRRLGARVAVFERSRAGAVHREWNASLPELRALVRAGLFTESELEDLVVARYESGVCRWFGGGTYPVRGVLDCSVDAGRLMAVTRQRSEAMGVSFFDGHTLVGHRDGDEAIAMRFRDGDGGEQEVTARLMIDARGSSSPSCVTDLVCPTVGGVLSGVTSLDPKRGDILVTTEDVEDGRQHVWEGFPGRPGEAAVYLFYYDRPERVGDGSLLSLYARFFATLPRYAASDARLLRPTFGYIPGWSRLVPGPQAPSPRVVLVGDSAARQSPLTYCGFGATLRSFETASRAIARALSEGHPAQRSLGEVVHDTPLHAGTGALAHMIASPPSDPSKAHALNALLDAAFSTLHAMGDDAYGALLRDEMSARDFTEFLLRTSRRHPAVYPAVLRVLGARGVARWGAGVARGLWSGGR